MVKIATASSNETIKSIKQAVKNLKVLSDEISFTSTNISYEVAEELRDEIVERYNSFVSEVDDKQYRGDTIVYLEKENDNIYRVVTSGKQVLYDEFGTGFDGAAEPHPDPKAVYKYKLDPYMSGPTGYINKYGAWVWRYPNDYVNYGHKAGAFVYDSLMDVSDNKAMEIAKKNIKSAISKSKKG